MKTVLLSLLLIGASAQAQSLQDLDAQFSQSHSAAEAELFVKLATQVAQKYSPEIAQDLKFLMKDSSGKIRYVVGEKYVCSVAVVYFTQLGIDRCLPKSQVIK